MSRPRKTSRASCNETINHTLARRQSVHPAFSLSRTQLIITIHKGILEILIPRVPSIARWPRTSQACIRDRECLDDEAANARRWSAFSSDVVHPRVRGFAASQPARPGNHDRLQRATQGESCISEHIDDPAAR